MTRRHSELNPDQHLIEICWRETILRSTLPLGPKGRGSDPEGEARIGPLNSTSVRNPARTPDAGLFEHRVRSLPRMRAEHAMHAAHAHHAAGSDELFFERQIMTTARVY